MPDLIEIEGDLVRIVNRTVRTEARLQDVMPHIERRIPVSLPILPRNRTPVIRFDPSNPTNMLLHIWMELPPAVRAITVNRGDGQKRLAMPWTLFYFRIRGTDGDPHSLNWSFDEWACFHSKYQITSPTQKVIPALLPNVFNDGRICFGTTGVNANQPLHDRLDEIVNTWYISAFNNIGHVRANYMPWGGGNLGDYTRWEEETAANPNCWRDWPEFNENTPEGRGQNPKTLIEHMDGTFERTTPIRLEGAIPDLPLALTFGRAEEWLNGLTNAQRLRLQNAIQTIARERPEVFVPDA